jgi:predicted small secreted protein
MNSRIANCGAIRAISNLMPVNDSVLAADGVLTFRQGSVNGNRPAVQDCQEQGGKMKAFRKLLVIVMITFGSMVLTGCHTVRPPGPPGLPPPPPIPVP